MEVSTEGNAPGQPLTILRDPASGSGTLGGIGT